MQEAQVHRVQVVVGVADLAVAGDLAAVVAGDLVAVAALVAVARLPIHKLSQRCGQEPLRALLPTQAW